MEKTKAQLERQQIFERFGLNFRIQHFVLLLSVIILVISGIPLWCLNRREFLWWTHDDSAGAIHLIETVRLVHRCAGVLLILVSVYHMIYALFAGAGRRDFWALLPRPKDFVDVTQNSLYFLRLSKKRPKFDRFSYVEKFDYWAVYWGCVIMIGSGLALWFDRQAAQFVPWFPYELAALIHSDEAILAALALFIWHFYNVHYNPSKFPMSFVWIHGRISREEQLEEHPIEYDRLLEAAPADSEVEPRAERRTENKAAGKTESQSESRMEIKAPGKIENPAPVKAENKTAGKGAGNAATKKTKNKR